MSIALSEFWTKLIEYGIADANGCKRIASSYCDNNSGSPPTDSVSLAKYLIRTRKLTEFQARALLAGRGLRSGSYVLQGDQAERPWSRWQPAQNAAGGVGFLFRAKPEDLAGGRQPWLETHAEISAPTLQPVEWEAADDGGGFVFSAIPSGRALNDSLSDSTVSAPEACRIGIAVADALASLHDRSLVHGGVRADRVWIGDDNQVILLRDPSGPPANSFEPNPYGWLDDAEPAEAYAAPELGAAGTEERRFGTDVYSIGCLLYRMVAGKFPFDGQGAAEVMAAHASDTVAELAEAVQKGEAGDPLYRVIAFAMAKNPAARFASAAQLADALRAVLPLIPKSSAAKQQPAAAPKRKSKEAKGDAHPGQSSKESGKASDTGKASVSGKKPSEPGKKPSEKARAKKASSETRPSDKTPVRGAAVERERGEKAAVSTEKVADKKVADKKVADKKVADKKVADKKVADKKVADKKEPDASSPPKASKGESNDKPTPQDKPVRETGPPIMTSLTDGQSEAVAPPAADQLAAMAAPAIETGAVTPQTAGEATDSPRSAERPLRRRKKKKSKMPLILGGMCVPVLLMMIMLIAGPAGEEAEDNDRRNLPEYVPPVTNRNADVNDAAPRATVDDRGYELADDETLLWVTPYRADSDVAPLTMLPPGPGVIVSLRAAALTRSDGIIETLSPELDGLIKQIESRSKVSLDKIERVGVALHSGNVGRPKASLAITLSTPQPLKELKDAWAAEPSRTRSGATIYASEELDADAYFVMPAGEGDDVSQFAVGSIEQMSEVAEAEGGTIPLPRSLQTLWNASSEQADVHVLLTPNFLFADGRTLLAENAPELAAPLKGILLPDVAGALLTFDIENDTVFAEVRLAPSGGVSEPALLNKLKQTIGGWRVWADDFLVDAVPDASWRRLANRLPFMMKFVSDQTRFGISKGSAVANVYIPRRAASQISLGVLLAVNTKPGGGGSLMTEEPVEPLTIDEMLDRKMSVSFDQESLEFAINTIVDEFQRSLPEGSTMPPVRIIGADLEAMGITQNQQIRDFSKSSQPLRAVLTDIVLGANPDKTATGPDDPKQSLVWVVADDPESAGSKAILVTTRKAAAGGTYELPPEFATAEPTE